MQRYIHFLVNLHCYSVCVSLHQHKTTLLFAAMQFQYFLFFPNVYNSDFLRLLLFERDYMLCCMLYNGSC